VSALPAAQVAKIVQEFLEEYTLRDEYFARKTAGGAERRMIYTQYVEPEGDGAHVEFAVETDDPGWDEGGEQPDPEVKALVDHAMDALRRAHPELANKTIRVSFL
jgi:hypothetical protein